MSVKKLAPVIVSAVLLITALVARAYSVKNEVKPTSTATVDTATIDSAVDEQPKKAEKEMRGVWVSYIELDMQNETDKSEASFREKFKSIASNSKNAGFNTLIVQVRPFCDALYDSKFFPYSHILSGEQGVNPGYDALEVMCEVCSQLDLDMFYKLFMMADRDILTNLDSSVLHFDDIKAYKDALSTIDIREDVCFACAGYECKESLIAAICDFTLTLDGINLSIVYSPKKDGIKLSIRSGGKYLSGVLAVNALRGIGTGGGHDNMAGGYVPYGKETGSKVGDADIVRLEHEIKARFLKEAGIK